MQTNYFYDCNSIETTHPWKLTHQRRLSRLPNQMLHLLSKSQSAKESQESNKTRRRMELKNHQRRMVRPNIAKRARLLLPKSLKAKRPLRLLARISPRRRTSQEANEEPGAEDLILPLRRPPRRSIDQKVKSPMMRRTNKVRRPKMELPRAVTKRRRLSLKSRKISSIKTQWTSKRRRPSRISTKSGNLVTGRRAQARPSSRLRPSSHQFQPNFSPSLTRPLS